MDTILILLLLYVLYKKFNKAATQKVNGSRQDTEAMKRAKKAKQKRTEFEKPQTLQVHFDDVNPPTLGEGQSHMAFTQDAHGCVSQREEYMGSLNADTSEGEDTCDQSLGHEGVLNHDSQSVYAAQIGTESPLDFSPKALYQGIVMSEILTRPAQCRRRRL